MNKFEDFFWNQDKKLKIHKWHHYLKIYDRHFKQFIGKNPRILEIGVYKGGSLEMWNHYFDNDCEIYAIDINEDCKKVPELLNVTNIQIDIGDQGDRNFWRKYITNKPKFDIIIDDGGHMYNQQIVTFEEMYHHMTDNGVYLCEDVHTSYWNTSKKMSSVSKTVHDGYDGGIKKSTTFIEYSKNLIDLLHYYWYAKDWKNHTGNANFKNPLPPHIDVQYKHFRTHTDSIHFYDSIVVIERDNNTNIPIATER